MKNLYTCGNQVISKDSKGYIVGSYIKNRPQGEGGKEVLLIAFFRRRLCEQPKCDRRDYRIHETLC